MFRICMYFTIINSYAGVDLTTEHYVQKFINSINNTCIGLLKTFDCKAEYTHKDMGGGG